MAIYIPIHILGGTLSLLTAKDKVLPNNGIAKNVKGTINHSAINLAYKSLLKEYMPIIIIKIIENNDIILKIFIILFKFAPSFNGYFKKLQKEAL